MFAVLSTSTPKAFNPPPEKKRYKHLAANDNRLLESLNQKIDTLLSKQDKKKFKDHSETLNMNEKNKTKNINNYLMRKTT